MATNKNKDSAALFELIGKSTLKVPKGGSLKIPAWWSSRSNEPRPEGTAPAMPASAAAPATPEAAAVPVQPVRQPAGVFAPADMDPAAAQRKSSNIARKQALLRTPKWAFVVLALGVLGVVVLAVELFRPKPPPAGGNTSLITNPEPLRPRAVIPGDARTRAATQARMAEAPPQTRPAEPERKARVWEEREVPRSSSQMYLVIASYHSRQRSLAERAANLLASKGVDVSIAPQKGREGLVLISVRGFENQNSPEADAFKKQVVDIGRALGRKPNSAWADAYWSAVRR